MRIVQINSVCDVGSTGRIAADLARDAIAEGNEVICAYGRESNETSDIRTIKIGNKVDFYWHIIETRLFDRHGLASKRATEKFLREIDKFKPDMFHLHNLHGYYINYPLLFQYIKEQDIKVQWTFHDSWPFTGHCAEPACLDCEKWKKDCSKCPFKNEYPKSRCISRSEKNYRNKQEAFLGVKEMTIITPSEWLAGLVRKSFLGGYEIKVVNNTIDKDVFKPTDSNFRRMYYLENKKVYLCVSFVWIDEKLKNLVKFADSLNDDEKLILVGLPIKKIKQLNNKKIIGIEKTNSKEDLAKIYSAADVFVNPTVKNDNYPTVNLEAQACGTPVVTYDSGGSPETVMSGMGTVVEWGDIEGLLREARKYCENKNI